MLRSTLLKSLAAASLALCLAVAPAEASEELTSSMTATCVGAGGSCDIVDFTLQVFGPDATYYMKDIQAQGMLGTWEFGSVQNVWSNGAPVTWSSSVSANSLNLSLWNDTPFDPAPIRIRVAMTAWGDLGELTAINYTANGYTAPDDITQGFFSTSGNVTVPEPITAVLFGTGLMGLLGGVGRRREDLGAEEDVA